MIETVLTECAVAEECYLSETLAWIAFYRFPLFDSPNGEGDVRFHHDYQEEYEPNIPFLSMPNNAECARAGIPPSPEFEALMNDEYCYIPEGAETLLTRADIDEKYKAELREDIKKAYAYHQKMDAWTEKYKAFIEVPRSKLFLALREGNLQAQGRRLPCMDLDAATEEMDKKPGWRWLDIEIESIPKNFWRQDGIDWENSAAKSADTHYFHIHVNVNKLLSLFPPPPVEEAKNVCLVADTYILSKATSSTKPIRSPRGRPAKDWDSFHIEMTDRLQRGDIPEKQEAFIQEMQVWCLQNWGKEPARSTVLQKVSPFYDRFIRKKSENAVA